MNARQAATCVQATALYAVLTLSVTCRDAVAIVPRLSDPTRSGGQFQFVLNGQTNTHYLIESSNDLRTWTVVLTNTESTVTRLVAVPATGSGRFWRAAAPLFQNAIAARGSVILGGSGWVDSFDSADPAYSTDGQYDPAKRKAGADVVSGTNTIGAVDVGNTKVAGVVTIGPGGTVSVGPNGGVGDLAFLSNPAYAGMIQNGHMREEMNSFLDMKAPSGPFFTPASGVVDGTLYRYVLGDGNYQLPSVALCCSEKAIVVGQAILYVPGTITLGGESFIRISSGASLKLYVGNVVNIGAVGIVNSGKATNFLCYGLSTSLNVTFQGSRRFNGAIYAPNANVTIVGSSTNDAVGAVVGKSVSLSGGLGFHFDENLKRTGPFF